MTVEAALHQARVLVGALVAGPLLGMAVIGLLDPPARVAALVAPASLLGLVSPVVGYRLYHLLRERIPVDADLETRCQSYVRANLAAMAVTEGAALFGLVAYFLSGELFTLVGVGAHVLLAGAIWPSPERFELFLEPPPGTSASS